MKRYKAINFEYDDAYGTGSALDIVEHDEGEFVKYEDIRNLLQNTSSNSNYEKCSHVIGLICGVLDITISECDELNLHEIYPKIVEIKNVVKELSQHFA